MKWNIKLKNIVLYLRSFLFILGHALTGAVAGLIAVIIRPLLPYSWRWRIVTLWNRFVMVWIYICCGVKFKVIGKRHFDRYPCVVMAKHQSTWETMFLQYYFGPVSTILKKELLRIPFFGWGLASLRPIAIDPPRTRHRPFSRGYPRRAADKPSVAKIFALAPI